MKKLILILLCLPLFIFSQEESKYVRTISFHEFLEDMETAANKGLDYELNNCEIIYNEVTDKIYHDETTMDYFGWELDSITLNKKISFKEKKNIRISNCLFNANGPLVIKNLHAHNIYLENVNAKWSKFMFDSISVSGKMVLKDISHITFNRSAINRVNIKDSIGQIKKEGGKWKRDYYADLSRYNFKNCNIGYFATKKSRGFSLLNNTISFLSIGGDIGECIIKGNMFEVNMRNMCEIHQKSKNKFRIRMAIGVLIENANIGGLICQNNKSKNDLNSIKNDTIIKLIETYQNSANIDFSFQTIRENFGWEFNTMRFNTKLTSNQFFIDASSMIIDEQLNILKNHLKNNDSLEIEYLREPPVKIINSEIKVFKLQENTFDKINVSDNIIEQILHISNLKSDSSFCFTNNTIPPSNKIVFDATLFNNLGFNYNKRFYSGNEDYKNIKKLLYKEGYQNKLNKLIMLYRQFISILNTQGNEAKNIGIMNLKNIQTNIKRHDYYEDPNINNWFNWKGFEFLKWYSDYGMNPFKALTYCFWAMFYFALFYFFFYSDWDKIDRGFLITRFNSVMDYFTTEKRIEDFYSSTHDKEMTTFTEFKNTLDKNKVHMPSMLASLAKPIYQISLLRYKLLNFSYKKAEFMAGRKWVDLEKKDRYWIGALTFFLTLTYIIYLVFIRALNSIVLSINAFSTLGFGQIPVRGFTKYVAIIEGFIGWFLLSVFIVSLLSQMMTV